VTVGSTGTPVDAYSLYIQHYVSFSWHGLEVWNWNGAKDSRCFFSLPVLFLSSSSLILPQNGWILPLLICLYQFIFFFGLKGTRATDNLI
jgi:hypothetical protein